MEKPYSKTSYISPTDKIRLLINSLDAELMRISSQTSGEHDYTASSKKQNNKNRKPKSNDNNSLVPYTYRTKTQYGFDTDSFARFFNNRHADHTLGADHSSRRNIFRNLHKRRSSSNTINRLNSSIISNINKRSSSLTGNNFNNRRSDNKRSGSNNMVAIDRTGTNNLNNPQMKWVGAKHSQNNMKNKSNSNISSSKNNLVKLYDRNNHSNHSNNNSNSNHNNNSSSNNKLNNNKNKKAVVKHVTNNTRNNSNSISNLKVNNSSSDGKKLNSLGKNFLNSFKAKSSFNNSYATNNVKTVAVYQPPKPSSIMTKNISNLSRIQLQKLERTAARPAQLKEDNLSFQKLARMYREKALMAYNKYVAMHKQSYSKRKGIKFNHHSSNRNKNNATDVNKQISNYSGNFYKSDKNKSVAVRQSTNSLGTNNISNLSKTQLQKMKKHTLTFVDPQPTGRLTIDRLSKLYRAKVLAAYRNRRIFTIYGHYDTLRQALLWRGWLEKLAPNRFSHLQRLKEKTLLTYAWKGNEYETVAISKLAQNFPSFFIWQPKQYHDLYVDVRPHRNRVRKGSNFDFSTKIGLIGCSEQVHWYDDDGVSGMVYPRFYRMDGNAEERLAFIEDFRRTQCRSVVRQIIDKSNKSRDIIDIHRGTIMPSILSFAVECVKRQLTEGCNSFLDDDFAQEQNVNWGKFLYQSGLVLQGKARYKMTFEQFNGFIKDSLATIAKLDAMNKDYKWDGILNVWILKPGYESRGRGIVVKNKIDDILQFTVKYPNARYIAQKYIERPLLIYKTKFDMRHYMLLTIGKSTVKIWLYKDCYLKFSGQEYSLNDFSESIHLTNNTVQRRYTNKLTRDKRLPKCNMWSLEQFKQYLKDEYGNDNIWNRKVRPGIGQNLIAVVLASFEDTNFVENAFEMYGCDFMLDEQFNPILIEINSTPDLSPSTEVTARICPNALKDLVKVVVDLPRNSRAYTGGFELIYEVNYKNKPDFDPKEGLVVSGKQMSIKQAVEPSLRQRVLTKLLATAIVKSVDRKIKIKKMLNNTLKVTSVPKPESSENVLARKTSTVHKLKEFSKKTLKLRHRRSK